MDHSNPAIQKFSHEQCIHGRCLNHNPDWENLGKVRLEPSPSFFVRSRTYWGTWCCGRPMARMKEVQTRRCRKCGRTEEHINHPYHALCLCCGRNFENVLPDKPKT
jgi:hypothetical protein